MSTYLVTNGLLLNEELCDKLIEAGLDKLHISLTGVSPDVYGHFQGFGLSKNECATHFKIVNQNAEYYLSKAKNQSTKREVTMSFIVNETSHAEMVQYALNWLHLGAELDIRPEGSDQIITHKTHPDNVVGYKHCNLVGHMLIKSNGDLLLSCCASKVPVLGNIFNNSICDILTSQEFIEMEHAFANLKIESLPEICVNCSFMHIYERKAKRHHDELTEKDESVFDNDGFKNNSLEEFYRQLVGRKLVMMGAGYNFHNTLQDLDKNVNIHAIVDNDINKHGTSINGIVIKPVESILDDDIENTVVLMTMNHFIEAENQLKSIGVSRYFSSVLLFAKYEHFVRKEGNR